MSKELKRCPFCCHEAVIEQTGKNQLTLKCKGCGVRFIQKWLRQTQEWLTNKMIDNWNKRTSLCEHCKGTGQIERTIGGFGNPEEDVPAVCVECNGTGIAG